MVLIVEDDENTRELYLEILRRAGFSCVATGVPEQALRWAHTQQFDAVLLDLGLPRISDGLRLAAQLRALPAAPPIIAATGYRLARPAAHFAVTLQKPVDADTIVSAVEHCAAGQLLLRF